MFQRKRFSNKSFIMRKFPDLLYTSHHNITRVYAAPSDHNHVFYFSYV